MAVRPVDLWVRFVNLVLLTSWLPLVPHYGTARWLALAHLTALTLPWLLARVGPAPSRLVRLLRDLYPLLWAAAFWSEFGLRQSLGAVTSHDAMVSIWDLMLFGHANLTWIAAMPWPALSEVMHGAYFSYYLMLVGAAVAVLCTRSGSEARNEIVVRIAVTYLGCFLIYSYFPVIGPRELVPIDPSTYTDGFFYQLNLGIRTAGDSLGTAFPSSHTAGGITFAWIAWRIGPRWLALVVTVLAALIALATVYTQNHFAVDTAAGVVVALFLQTLVADRLLRPALEPTPRASRSVLVPNRLTEAA